MGGECYRYCRLKPNVAITEKEEQIYQELLSSIIIETKRWFADEKSEEVEWMVEFDGLNAVELQVKDREHLDGRIVIPKELNNTLNVGWQHRQYGTLYDPKYEIATKIMDLLMNSDLSSIINEEEEDNIRSDLGMDDCLDDSEEEEHQSKGLFHYSNGISDDSWSRNGMYGGYDDWETYCDANGLD